MKLTCVEAIGATLYIVGLKEEAINLLTVFDWGKEFLKINHDILERYSMTTNSNEIVKAQNEWLIENGVDIGNNNNNNHGDVDDDSKTNETSDGNVKEESNTNVINDMNRDEDNNNNKTTLTNKTKKTIVNVEMLPLISNNQIINNNNNNNDKTNIDTSTTTSNGDDNDSQTPSSLLDMASLKLKNDNVVEIDNKDTSSVSSTTTTTNKDNEGHVNNNNNNQILIIPTIKDIKKMKPPQLRKFLKSRNINTQGNKKELIKRCLEIIKDI